MRTSGLTWKMRRLRSMSGPEVIHRLRQAANGLIARMSQPHVEVPSASIVTTPSWFDLASRTHDSYKYIDIAEQILAGQFQVFALRDASLGFPPQWNQDPKSKTQAPMAFGKAIDYRREDLVGNIKYLWEINRHLELVTLAQAWHLTREPRFAAGCKAYLDSWFEQCPYPKGPNWTSSLELGIRLLNWSVAWYLLGGPHSHLFEDDAGRLFQRRWLASVYQHCHFIAGHLSRFSSANNHLLGELLGLLIGSVTWPFWNASRDWERQGREGLEHECTIQNAVDGTNLEQATWYHHEVVDMMIIAGLASRSAGREFSTAFWDRTERMLEFLASIMDVGGNVPAFGDADDAVMVRFDPSDRFDAYKSLLATGAVLFERSDFAVKAGCFDDKSRWLVGDDGARRFEECHSSRSQLPCRRDFPNGGYYILGSDFETSSEVKIVADVAPLGYLSIAAHGHADALSFTLSVSGNEILVDPGTFSYHTARQWRDYFRGTSAHNTVRVDGVDQSVSGGNFLWLRHATTKCEAFDISSRNQRLVGSHDGYLRLRSPVRHRRCLTYDTAQRTLLIDDEIESTGRHRTEIFWHFSERCDLQLIKGQILAVCGRTTVRLAPPAEARIDLYRGHCDPPLGWVSRSFDSKVASGSVVATVNTSGHWRGRSIIQIESV